MTRMIDRLEKKMLLRRVRNPHDRRIIQLELTASGNTMLPVLQTCSTNVAARLLRGFSQSDIDEFKHLLERFLANS